MWERVVWNGGLSGVFSLMGLGGSMVLCRFWCLSVEFGVGTVGLSP